VAGIKARSQKMLDIIENADHIAVIEEEISKHVSNQCEHPLKSPSALQTSLSFLNPTTNEPLYSVEAIAAKCHELCPDKYPAPTANIQKARNSKNDGDIVLKVKYQDSWTQVEYSSKPTLNEVLVGLKEDFGLADLSQLRLHYSTSTGDEWFVISTDTKLHKALSQSELSKCTWALRPLSPPPVQGRGITSCSSSHIFHDARLKLELGPTDRQSSLDFETCFLQVKCSKILRRERMEQDRSGFARVNGRSAVEHAHS
jgi:hypothetical protein